MIELEIIFLGILILLSGFFSGSEVALISLDKLDLRKLSKQRAEGIQTLRKLKKNPRRMLTTILIGNNIVNIVASSLATVIAIDSFGSMGMGIAVGIMTLFILIFGEIFPKTYCESNSYQVALLSAPIVYALSKIFYPIIILFESIPTFLLKHVFKTKRRSDIITEEDILTFAELGVESNAIHHREKVAIEKILRFNDVEVKHVMIPKSKMICINANSTVKDALSILDKYGHSRHPVFQGKRSRIIGIVHIKEIMKALHAGEEKMKIRFLTLNIVKIKENERIDMVFLKLQKTHVHMAPVYNKRKKLVGFVTLEDLIEEIVGEIEDEEDIVRSLNIRKI